MLKYASASSEIEIILEDNKWWK